MKTHSKKLVASTVAILMAFSCLVLLPSQEARGATIYVTDNLQDAINASSDGDTIHINTTTLEPGAVIWVNKSIIIEGNGTANTIIDGSTNSLTVVLNVTAENVTIRNLAITGASNAGIYLETGTHAGVIQTPSNITITDVYIHNNTNYGIYVTAGTYGAVVNSTIENNGDGGDNEGGLYMTKDLHWAIVGNLFNGNNQNGIYSTENTDYDTTVYLYNMFKNNTAYGIESPGGTIRADHNCWYNVTTGTWGGIPDADGVDNISASVTANIYYNGTVTASGTVLTRTGTNTYAATIDMATIIYHEEGLTYQHWLAGAIFSEMPIGTVPSHYTGYPIYAAFNLSGREHSSPGLATGDWLNLSFYYDFAKWPSKLSSQQNDATVASLFHYNGTTWTEGEGAGKNTTNVGDYEGYVYANFTENPLSPIMIMLNGRPTASFTYTPSSPRVGQTITFDATNSTDPEDGDNLNTYRWNFGDGGSTTDAVGSTVTTSYDAAGDYDVTLTVTDWLGRTGTIIKTITVSSGTGTGVSPGTGSYTLTVTITSGGTPLSGVTVTLAAGGVTLATSTTDSNGQVVFGQVEGLYMVTASKTGYTASTQYVTVASNTNLQMILAIGSIADAPILFGLTLPVLVLAILAFIGLLAMLYVVASNKKLWATALVWNLTVFLMTLMLWLLTWVETTHAMLLMAVTGLFALFTVIGAEDEVERWKGRRQTRW